MKYPTAKPAHINSKVLILSGGLKEEVSQLQVKGGTMYSGYNYQEIDGVYHGYSSIPGYEAFDGQDLASGIDTIGLTDYGDGLNTSLLLESNDPVVTADLSSYGHIVGANSSLNDTTTKEFQASSFYFSGTEYITVIPTGVTLNLEDDDFTIETRIRPNDISGTQLVMNKELSYKIELVSGKVKFSYSTDGATWTDSFTSVQTLSVNTWSHIAVVRKSGNMYVLLGGVKDSNSYACSTDIIYTNAAFVFWGVSSFTGNLDELRISSVYRWIFDFEVPNKPYSTANYYYHQYDDEAREAQRALIGEVPGAGPVRFVGTYAGIIGAIRDNVAGTEAHFYLASPTGWSHVAHSVSIMQYENGTDKDADVDGFLVGQTIIGVGSGATGVVHSINLESGAWVDTALGRDAAGFIIVENVVGGPFLNGDVLTGPGGDIADLVTDSYGEWNMQPDGVYDAVSARFDLFPGLQRVEVPFGANGVNFPAYFDGTQLIPILSTELPDAQGVFATHIEDFKNRLWLAYPDGRLHYSAVGEPTNFAEVDGAGSIYIEDEITGLQEAPGDVLIVFCRNSIKIVKNIKDSQIASGQTQADYAFYVDVFSKRSGAIASTHERLLGDIFFMDDRGMTKMSAVDAFGDFALNSISKNVQNTLLAKKDIIVGIVVNRAANQFRIYFEDKTAFCFTFNAEKKIKGITALKYDHTPTVLAEGEDGSGSNVMYMGSDDGFVYKLDSGTSFNGGVIETKLVSAFHSYGSPTNWKRFQKVTLESQATKGLVFVGKPEFNYREQNIPRGTQEEYISPGAGGVWGLDAWSEFQYGGAVVQSPALYLTGYGNNMSLTILTSNKYVAPHVLNSMIVEYSTHARKM